MRIFNIKSVILSNLNKKYGESWTVSKADEKVHERKMPRCIYVGGWTERTRGKRTRSGQYLLASLM